MDNLRYHVLFLSLGWCQRAQRDFFWFKSISMIFFYSGMVKESHKQLKNEREKTEIDIKILEAAKKNGGSQRNSGGWKFFWRLGKFSVALNLQNKIFLEVQTYKKKRWS